MVQLREKSRRVPSPDQLGSYIKVSKPPVWMTLGVIATLIVAGVVWFFAGTISENAVGPAVVTQTSAKVYVPLSDSSSVQVGDSVTLESSGEEFAGQVRAVLETPVALSAVTDACGTTDLPSFSQDSWAVEVDVETQAAPGTYATRITTATHRPIRLLLGLD